MNLKENDESLLIDFCLRRLDDRTALAVGQRMERDAEFCLLHQNIARSLQALNLLPEPEAPRTSSAGRWRESARPDRPTR